MSKPTVPAQEDHRAGEADKPDRDATDRRGRRGLSSRAGTALIASLADRLGLTAALSEALCDLRERRSKHDPGRTARDLALSLADGGDCLADLRALRDQPTLFGAVASYATAWRLLADLDEQRLGRLRAARAATRRGVWEQLHRARAACEDRIRCAKDTGLEKLPFRAFQANAAWLELVLLGQDLLTWTQLLLLQKTELARCEPKRLRYRLLHVAGRLTRHARRLVLHLPRRWPWQRELLQAFERLKTLPQAA